MQGLLCSVRFKLGTVVVFFLMCKIPSPSLLFAITLWKAGLPLCWLSASSPLTRARWRASPALFGCLRCGGFFFFFLLSQVKGERVAFVWETKQLAENYMASAKGSVRDRSCALGWLWRRYVRAVSFLAVGFCDPCVLAGALTTKQTEVL